MKEGKLKKVTIDCPICGLRHEIVERTRSTSTIIKDEPIKYVESFYCCHRFGDDYEFTTGEIEDHNLLNARNAYRLKHGLLTSDEIVSIRNQYALSQADMARLLGWGEATISRYESKAIQDEAHDRILRIVRDDPMFVLECFKKNKGNISMAKNKEIIQRIVTNVGGTGLEPLQRKVLESEYVNYMEPSIFNGNKSLDIDKLEIIISYLAKRVKNLFKVKLMKMLWYVDSLSYKNTGKSMTGLVYVHQEHGALALGHSKIMNLPNVKVEEKDGIDYTIYHFLPNEYLTEDVLLPQEIKILDKVIDKFCGYNASEIAEYMHKEKAYSMTKMNEIIPFVFAKDLEDF